MRFLKTAPFFALSLLLTQCEETEPTVTLDQDVSSADGASTNAAPVPVSMPQEVTFNEHIQPLLSEYCYHCHGPDEGTRLPESEPLRLDLADDAFEPRENGKPVIIKGDAKASYLVKLLHSTDPDTIMPPPESHKTMSADQIALIEAWIDQGAEYQDHWAFMPTERPETPRSESGWSEQPIDQFIEAKLSANQLKPNEDESPARLYRRLHFDLTGLPPTPEKVAAFEEAAGSDLQKAVEGAADELLATTASAEHFARYWLDAARYADTHGIHIDNYRAIWPYRDWVIDAFKKNMPWDQFTIEQIAGDMLPDADLDQKVATGFHRCLPTTGEGGAIAEEYLAIYAQDRTDTTSAVWLGLTMGCAACHDHKFDPITMKDNYSFNAFFRNTPMTALDRNNANHPPNVFVPLHEDRKRYAELKAQIDELDAALASRREAAKPSFDEWAKAPVLDDPRKTDPSLSFHLPLSEAQGPKHGVSDGKELNWNIEAEHIDGPLGPAPIISNQPIILGDHASFARGDQVSFGAYVYFEGKPNGSIISRMNPKQEFKGWDLFFEGDKPIVHIIDSWPNAANKLRRGRGLPGGKWHHIMATFDGRQSGHQSLSLYVDGERARVRVDPNSVGGNIVTDAPLILGSRADGDSKLTGGKVALQDFRLYRRVLSAAEIQVLSSFGQVSKIIATPRDQWTDEQSKKLFGHFIDFVDEPSKQLVEQKAPLAKEFKEISDRGSISLVMEEKKEEPFAHMLNRGVYSDKGDKVTPEAPAFLPPMPEDAPRNRIGLANWLVSKDNPLTARVTMNRLWYQLFGTGIVETVGDFGIMGARPSHPKLLDWLATEFMDSGWDHRHMVKVIVSSKTYRQSAHANAEKLELDPHNTLISRGPRYRLAAEELRDMALAASGLLADAVGGPPVRPYQPEGIWSAVAMPQSNTRNYQQDSGEALYRRSLYTFWKRTAPHPAMEILNAPTREVVCVQREMTNTPLQAFVTLNDPQFVEAARNLAQRAIAEGPDFDTRADFITQRFLARALNDSERPLVKQTLDAATAAFEKTPADATALLEVGETKHANDMNSIELAAWTVTTSQILNLDETLNK